MQVCTSTQIWFIWHILLVNISQTFRVTYRKLRVCDRLCFICMVCVKKPFNNYLGGGFLHQNEKKTSHQHVFVNAWFPVFLFSKFVLECNLVWSYTMLRHFWLRIFFKLISSKVFLNFHKNYKIIIIQLNSCLQSMVMKILIPLAVGQEFYSSS